MAAANARARPRACPVVLVLASGLHGAAAGAGQASSALVAAAEVAQASNTPSCGISGILSGYEMYQPPETLLGTVCERMMTTNCSVSYSPLRCPDDCLYLVPNQAFSCLFQCVPREECSRKNPDRAFPDPETRLCSKCSVEGCRLCDSRSVCSACHEGFVLTGDGKCAFLLDQRLQPDRSVKVVCAVLGGLILLAILWHAKMGQHPNAERNMVAILRARRHRHFAKVHRWQLNGKRMVWDWYNPTVHLRRRDILGVGLPLFYNNVCFMILVSALSLGVTYMAYTTSAAGSAFNRFQDEALEELAMHPQGMEPAIVLSPLAPCGMETASDVKAALLQYAGRNFYAVGFLYVTLFVLSLKFGQFQRSFAREFDSQNTTMSDYALHVSGLPSGCTDEESLRQWLEEAFRAAMPSAVRRPPRIRRSGPREVAVHTERPDSQVEVSCVSICYDYHARWAEVDDAMWKLMEHMEVQMHRQAKCDEWLLDDQSTTAAYSGQSLEEVHREQRRRVSAWFGEGSTTRLKGTGEAFVVFRYIADKERVMKYHSTNPNTLRHPDAPSTPVLIQQILFEPPSVYWWHIGIPRSKVWRRTFKNLFYLFLLVAAVQLCLVLPFAHFIVLPYSNAGQRAGGTKMTIAGVVLGNVNGLLFMANYLLAYRLGYAWKDEMDAFVLFANTCLVLINTFFNIFTTAYMVTRQTDLDSVVDFMEIRTLKAMGTEHALARSMYELMMPGSFFIGLVMWAVMAGVVPFIWNTFLMKLIYVWRCLPDSLLRVLKVFLPWAPQGLEYYPFRSAEKAFEPAEVSIAGNYADQIVTPTVCFTMLFFLSPFVWRAFLGMLLWSCFELAWFRWLHFRYCKTCYYTTHYLDSFVNCLWAGPLSVVAAAWMHWGIRSGRFASAAPAWAKALLITTAFWISVGLWLLSYNSVVRPFRQRNIEEEDDSKTVGELSSETVYTWLNCNPAYVLKCQYYFRDEEGRDLPERRRGHPLACGEDPSEVRFFEVGKQYLFVKPERQPLVYRHGCSDSLEFETYFEHLLRLFGWACEALASRGLREGRALHAGTRHAGPHSEVIPYGLLLGNAENRRLGATKWRSSSTLLSPEASP